MAKRKLKESREETPVEELRRSSRQKTNASTNDVEKKEGKPPATTSAVAPKLNKSKKQTATTIKSNKKEHVKEEEEDTCDPESGLVNSASSVKSTEPRDLNASTRQYWLMKAEPESRLEKGHDIKFSIDDLAAKSVPEPWDGIRAYPARNNIRAMKKGDLAFFYHSSCKVPAIVGIMEIVQEHTPDLSAHDPKAPYYDPKSSPNDPKWSVVHVEFRQKLKTPVTLKELKAWFGEKGSPLENMQMLKLARLSVSKVSSEEWKFLVGEMARSGDLVDG